MMYRNKITGNIVEAESKLKGAWEAVSAPPTSLNDERREKKKRVANNKMKEEK